MTGAGDRPAPSTWAARAPWLAALFGVLVVAWSPKLVPNFFASDDLAVMHHAVDFGTMLHQGRPGQAALFGLLDALGAQPAHAGTLLNWLALGLFALASLLLLLLWDLPLTPISVLCAGVAFVHPNLAEVFTFRFVPIFFAAATVLALGGLERARRGAFLAGALLILLSFTIYQVTVNLLLTAIALGVALDCARGDAPASAVVRAWVRPAAAVGLAATGYLVIHRLVQAFLGPSGQGARGHFLSLDAVPGRVQALGIVFRRVLGDDRVLSTGLLYLLQLAVLAGALGATTVSLIRRRRAPEAALALAGVTLALGSVVGVVAFLSELFPAPRVLTAAGPFWAGVLVLVTALTVGRWRSAVAIAAGTLLLGYMAIDHRVASDQVRLNARDLSVATRIVARLESLPGWRGVERVAILGASRKAPGIPQEFDLNPSALSVPWARVMLLREITDRRLSEPSADELQVAERRCAAVEGWPSTDSVSIDGPLAVICFR